jgi:hypothetical protein
MNMRPSKGTSASVPFHLSAAGWLWRGFLLLVGCVAAAYVGDELLGGEALGWIAGGAILGATGAPMFKVLLARNAARAAARQ